MIRIDEAMAEARMVRVAAVTKALRRIQEEERGMATKGKDTKKTGRKTTAKKGTAPKTARAKTKRAAKKTAVRA